MTIHNHLYEFNLKTSNLAREHERLANSNITPLKKRNTLNVWAMFPALVQWVNRF